MSGFFPYIFHLDGDFVHGWRNLSLHSQFSQEKAANTERRRVWTVGEPGQEVRKVWSLLHPLCCLPPGNLPSDLYDRFLSEGRFICVEHSVKHTPCSLKKKSLNRIDKQIYNSKWGSEETNLRVGRISGQLSRKGNLGSVPRSDGRVWTSIPGLAGE